MAEIRKESDSSGSKEKRSRSNGNNRSVSNIVRKLSHRSSGKRSVPGYSKGNMIPPHCKFKLVVQTVKPELTVCFMLAETPGYALTCNKTEDVFAEKVINDIKFRERCSFIPSVNLWFDGFCAFESVRESSRYLLFFDGRFYFKKYDGTEKFKKDASFLFTKEVNVFSSRRSQSSIIPPDPSNLKVNTTKSRKFSLISFRSSGRNNSSEQHHHSELQQMIPTGVLPLPEMLAKGQSKKETFSLGLNQCRDCLTLTNFQYISERLAKEEDRLRSHSGLLSLTSSVTFSEHEEIELLTQDASSI